MKKFLLLIAMSAMVWTAKSQTIFAGGAVGVSCSDEDFQMAILPEVGYEFNDKLAVGGGVGYEYLYEESFMVINPYVRYTPWHNDRLFLDVKLQSQWYFCDEEGFNITGFTPSFRYRLSDKWEVATDLGIFGIQIWDGEATPTFALKNCSVNASVLYRF